MEFIKVIWLLRGLQFIRYVVEFIVTDGYPHLNRTRTLCIKKAGNCNNRVDCSPSSSLQYRYSTLWLPSFWLPEEVLQGRHFADDNRLKCSVHAELWYFSKEFYVTSLQHLTQRLKKSLSIIKETLWKNNPNFVKDVPMIYVNFIKIEFIIAEEKMGGLLSYHLSYVCVKWRWESYNSVHFWVTTVILTECHFCWKWHKLVQAKIYVRLAQNRLGLNIM